MTVILIPDKHNKYEIPKSVLSADRLLRATYPQVYHKISGYRNSGPLDEIELERLKFHVSLVVDWELVQKTVMKFIGNSNTHKTKKPMSNRGIKHKYQTIKILPYRK